MRAALDHGPVDRNPFAGPDPHQHAGNDLAHRPAPLDIALDQSGHLALGRQQRRQVARRLGAAGRLEIAADSEQHQHHARGIEIDVGGALDNSEGGINISGASANDDQRR